MNETRTRARPTDVVIGRLEGFAADAGPAGAARAGERPAGDAEGAVHAAG